MRVGVIADTHGLLRPRVVELLAGCDRILHAGDVGGAEVLLTLRQIVPLAVVRGNTDSGPDAEQWPLFLVGELGSLAFGMIHRREDVPFDWPKRLRLIVFGYTLTNRSSPGEASVFSPIREHAEHDASRCPLPSPCSRSRPAGSCQKS